MYIHFLYGSQYFLSQNPSASIEVSIVELPSVASRAISVFRQLRASRVPVLGLADTLLFRAALVLFLGWACDLDRQLNGYPSL